MTCNKDYGVGISNSRGLLDAHSYRGHRSQVTVSRFWEEDF